MYKYNDFNALYLLFDRVFNNLPMDFHITTLNKDYMKKFAVLMLLCLGLSIGANAQDSSISTKADLSAKKLANAIQKGMDGIYSEKEFDQKCIEIGSLISTYMAPMSPEEQKTFTNELHTKLINYCIQYGLDPDTSRIMATAVTNGLTQDTEGSNDQQREPVAEMAKRYAKEMAKLIEASFLGTNTDKEAGRIGAQLGVDLSRLDSDNIKVFKELFYRELESQMSKTSGLDANTRSTLLNWIKIQYDPLFQYYL